ncbi:restriction endonuclease subunit S [Winogradskyella sp.]|uniref:restriction endonuclease subunit S n=1 Tax=Winogradskyella sp. TaxID=1883156 RepID=UPI003AB580A5
MSGRKATTNIIPGKVALSVGKGEIKLPTNWVLIPLNDVATLATGHTPSRKKSEYWGGDIPWMSVGDARKRNGKEIFETKEYTNKLGIDNSAAVLLPKHTVCLSRTASIGYSILLGKPMATSQGFVNWKCSRLLVPKYLQLLFIAENKFLYEISEGTAHTTIYFPEVKAFHIALPSLPEQTRIVAKLDQLIEQLDQIKESLEKIPQLLKDFRQQVLTQAVTGKLTEEWRSGKEFESADELIEKIINKRKSNYESDCKIAKQNGQRKPTKSFLLELPDIEKINIVLPSNWFQTNVHFLAFVTKLAGFEYSEHFDMSEQGEIPVVRAQNVQMGKFEDKNRLFISKKVSDYLVRSQLHGREILMVFIGAGTGNVCMAPTDERWHLAPNVAKIDIDGINTNYLYLYLQSPLGITNVLSRVKATAQPSLSMATIREIIALVPPIIEQEEIVTRVETLFSKANSIEQQYQTLKQKIDTLPQAILHKAFKGELVPQLDSDGDARELLEEIKALKKQTAKPKTKKGNVRVGAVEPLKKSKAYKVNDVELGRVAEESKKYK